MDALGDAHVGFDKVRAVGVGKADLVFHALTADGSVLAALDGRHELEEAAFILFLWGIEEGKARIGAFKAAVDVGVAFGALLLDVDIGGLEGGVERGIVDVVFHTVLSLKKGQADALGGRIRL